MSILLAPRFGLHVTAVDLDPAMIVRARANRPIGGTRWSTAAFLVGDVASLAFPNGSFDVVVSTLSMHHLADPTLGLAEVGHVLRKDGRVFVWDFRAGPIQLHGRLPDPLEQMRNSSLGVVSATPWRSP